MPTFIGIIFTCVAVLVIVKILNTAIIKFNLRNAVGYASGRGVPNEFSEEIIKDRNLMLYAHDIMTTYHKNTPFFKSRPIIEQYGQVIVRMYEGVASEKKQKQISKVISHVWSWDLSAEAEERRKNAELITGRIVNQWDNWRLLHFQDHNYELNKLVENEWLIDRPFSAVDDDDATKKAKELISAVIIDS